MDKILGSMGGLFFTDTTPYELKVMFQHVEEIVVVAGIVLIVAGALLVIYPPLLSLIVAAILIAAGVIVISIARHNRNYHCHYENPTVEFFFRY